MKVNAKSRPARTGVTVDVSPPYGSKRYAEAQKAQEDRVAANIRGAGMLQSRGGASPERTEGERRR